MAITCPACGLKNPRSAVMCDCRHVLNRNVDSETLAKAALANDDMRRRRSVAVPVSVGVAVLLIVLLRVVLRVI